MTTQRQQAKPQGNMPSKCYGKSDSEKQPDIFNGPLATQAIVELTGLRYKKMVKQTIQYLDQDSVEQCIMKNNEQWFRLMETTPPMMAPLVNDVGYLGVTTAAAHILDGTYVCPLEVDQYISK